MGSFFIDPEECSTIQIFQLFVAYAYLMFIGCNMISDGAELLMLTPYSKLVGSCILPILGAVPDGALVLFSGLGPDAQENLDVGVGALAGSTVMLITIPWALAIWGGRVDLGSDGEPVYSVPRDVPRLTPGNVCESGVGVGTKGAATLRAMAAWMACTAAPYVIIEVGALVAEARRGGVANRGPMGGAEAEDLSLAESNWALVALCLTIGGFASYLRTQYARAFHHGGVMERQTVAATRKVVRDRGVGIIAALEPHLREASRPAAYEALGGAPLDRQSSRVSSLLSAVLLPFFSRYDVDGDEVLRLEELGRVFEDMNEPKSDVDLDAIFREFDADGDGNVSFDEFCAGMVKYAEAKKALAATRAPRPSVATRRASASTPRGPSPEPSLSGRARIGEASTCSSSTCISTFSRRTCTL